MTNEQRENVEPQRDAKAAHWTRIPISSIEDLSDGVLGADLKPMQMSRAPVKGSLAFAIHDDAIFSSGHIGSPVAVSGPLSDSMVTLGAGVILPPGSRQWLSEVATGEVGVFRPGDPHDGLYAPGSIYVTATLPIERLEQIAARQDLVLDSRVLGGTGISTKKFSESTIATLQAQFKHIHTGSRAAAVSPAVAGDFLLQSFVEHFARPPQFQVGRTNPQGMARVVAVARAFIHENLDRPLSIDKIAAAASTSRRTLHRAFQIVLDETPYSYVMKLRLHRIRHELLSGAELARTITAIANRWSVGELGRFAGEYRDFFGELPSETRRNVVRLKAKVWQELHSQHRGVVARVIEADDV